MPRLINIDLVPNFEDDDYEIIKNLLKEKYKKEELEKTNIEILEILKNYFPQGEIFFFNSARGALTFLLSILEINDQNNIITQAFSCLVVPNAIKFAHYKPIYVDIDETYNLDVEDLKRKINEKVKAIIIQNTFGLPAKINEILEIAHQYNILVIENLTHSLGAKYKEKYLGNFGDVALLSLNRNKVISSIIGAALIVNKKELAEKIKNIYKSLPELSQKEIQKIIFTGKVLYEAKKNYNFLTKIYLKFLRKIGKTMEMVSFIERQSKKPKNYLFKFPEILSPLLLNQLKKLEKFNEHRKNIAKIYLKKFSLNFEGEPIFLRFPILIENRDFVLEKFKKENIYLGDWYKCVLDPCSDLKNFDYKIGSCPQAEKKAKMIINLPTLIDKEKAEYIVKILIELRSSNNPN